MELYAPITGQVLLLQIEVSLSACTLTLTVARGYCPKIPVPVGLYVSPARGIGSITLRSPFGSPVL